MQHSKDSQPRYLKLLPVQSQLYRQYYPLINIGSLQPLTSLQISSLDISAIASTKSLQDLLFLQFSLFSCKSHSFGKKFHRNIFFGGEVNNFYQHVSIFFFLRYIVFCSSVHRCLNFLSMKPQTHVFVFLHSCFRSLIFCLSVFASIYLVTL